MSETMPGPRRTRRDLLRTGGVLAAGAVGWSAMAGTAHALTGHSVLDSADCKFYYEPTGNPVTLRFNDTFYNQLCVWKRWTSYNVPDTWGSPVEAYSFGAYVNKPGMHGEGRAFDLARYNFRNSSGGVNHLSCRYDHWRGTANESYLRPRYWGLACSLARYFQHVITYYDNSDHYNHIHADNAVYGSPTHATYKTSSTSQTYIVQAACRYVWGHGTAVDGDWGPETSADSTAVLRRIGRSSGTVASSGANWTAFCAATFRKAMKTEDY